MQQRSDPALWPCGPQRPQTPCSGEGRAAGGARKALSPSPTRHSGHPARPSSLEPEALMSFPQARTRGLPRPGTPSAGVLHLHLDA